MVEPVTYAMINPLNDYVEGVVTIEYEHVQQDGWIIIPENDQSLIGKWYNPADGQFYDKPHGYLIRLKTVDGANSGLDADTVDGKHASEFLGTTGGAITGDLDITGEVDIIDGLLRLDGAQTLYNSGENLIIGTNNLPTIIACKADEDVTINGTNLGCGNIHPRGHASHGIGISSKRWNDVYLINSPNVSSDRRLKENIEAVDIDEMLEFINKLEVVDYNFISQPDVERIGLIAQDVETAGGSKYIDIGDDGMYGLKTSDMVYPLIASIQALSKQNAELMERVAELEKAA